MTFRGNFVTFRSTLVVRLDLMCPHHARPGAFELTPFHITSDPTPEVLRLGTMFYMILIITDLTKQGPAAVAGATGIRPLIPVLASIVIDATGLQSETSCTPRFRTDKGRPRDIILSGRRLDFWLLTPSNMRLRFVDTQCLVTQKVTLADITPEGRHPLLRIGDMPLQIMLAHQDRPGKLVLTYWTRFLCLVQVRHPHLLLIRVRQDYHQRLTP